MLIPCDWIDFLSIRKGYEWSVMLVNVFFCYKCEKQKLNIPVWVAVSDSDKLVITITTFILAMLPN